MKNTLIIVTDLEQLKAYRVDNDPLHSNPRLELIDTFKTGAARKLVEETTDLAGRFPRASVAHEIMGGMSAGERHNIELEKRKRCLRQLSRRINGLVKAPDVERCFLACSREINNALLAELDPEVRARIEIDVASDLTKVNRSDLLSHFKSASRAGALA
ncbi:MAG TPA: host attachment protein [Verrucomicrobiae bacterium]|nr:host attachment protein [Verrucomicrobiae bacterium]